MGYRSEVLIKIPANKYKEFAELVKENYEDYSLLELGEETVTIKNHEGDNIKETWIYFPWIKWYDHDYEDVIAITKALNTFSDKGISWSFGRCGEDMEDNYIQHDSGEDPDKEVSYCEIERTLC